MQSLIEAPDGKVGGCCLKKHNNWNCNRSCSTHVHALRPPTCHVEAMNSPACVMLQKAYKSMHACPA